MKNFDSWIFFSLIFLFVFSLINLFGINKELFYNQLIFIVISLSIYFAFYKIGLFFFKENEQLFFYFGLFFLFVTFVTAPEIRGSKRWLNFYFFNLQLSEIFKPFFIITLSKSFSKKTLSFKNLFVYLIPIFIIFKQPDLGNAMLYFIVLCGLLFFSKLPIKKLIFFALIVIILLPISWHFLAEYQKQRIISFLNPQIDSKGISYNQIQSVITIGSGGFFGRGLGLGTQSRLAFLPENHTDFVFASFVEQFGFIGGFFILFLYFLICWRVLKKIYLYRNERFLFLFFVGVMILFISHIFINIGMNLGIMPITGITLPILSYGGSSLVSIMIIFGLTSYF